MVVSILPSLKTRFSYGGQVMGRRPIGNRPVGAGVVIKFPSIRSAIGGSDTRTVFYLGNSSSNREALGEVAFLKVISAQCLDTLSQNLLIHQPNLIFIESGLLWSCPFQLTSQLEKLLDVPIGLVYRPEELEADPNLLKKAFAAGVSDTLGQPMNEDELSEVLNVFLKMRVQISV